MSTQICGCSPNPLIGVSKSGQIDNSTIGFFSVTPAVQQNHLIDPTASSVPLAMWAADLNKVLEEYGLVKTS